MSYFFFLRFIFGCPGSCCAWAPLVGVSGAESLRVVPGLLIGVTSLAAEPGLSVLRLQWLRLELGVDSLALEHRLVSCDAWA